MAYILIGSGKNYNMRGKEIFSHDELIAKVKDKERVFLLLYKKGSEQSECSLKNLHAVEEDHGKVDIFMADVTNVKDIHEKYSITSVTTILEFAKGEFVNVLKGCHEPGFYKSFFENAIYAAKVANNNKPQKRVTVYTTPTCSWCTTIKTHLKKHGIRYTELDVSRDQNAAAEMQRKSGQMGVPQTYINGEMVVGFDKAKINRLLGIQG
jgi:glutaredoxin-like YruB-family protein